jgi:hypothetical protein
MINIEHICLPIILCFIVLLRSKGSYGGQPSPSLRLAVPAEALAKAGRGGGIRTRDPLRPRQVRYQTALRPEQFLLAVHNRFTVGPASIIDAKYSIVLQF